MQTDSQTLAALRSAIIGLIREAGEAVMDVYATNFTVETKADDSLVTLADQHAEALIIEGLRGIEPSIPVISEESFNGMQILSPGNRFWLVDPLDGTKEFVDRNGEFTVNIALIEDQRPILGVVFAPAQERLFSGAEGIGAFVDDARGCRAIRTRAVPNEGLTVVCSRSHGHDASLECFLATRRVAMRANVGSSLKLCLVASGEADLYPRFGRTMEWDIAAGDAVLRAAGGLVRCLQGSVLIYGKPGFDNPHLVATGSTLFDA